MSEADSRDDKIREQPRRKSIDLYSWMRGRLDIEPVGITTHDEGGRIGVCLLLEDGTTLRGVLPLEYYELDADIQLRLQFTAARQEWARTVALSKEARRRAAKCVVKAGRSYISVPA